MFGRDWFATIRLDWAHIAHVSLSPELQQLLKLHAAVFKNELGTVKEKKISLSIREESQPKFFRPCQVSLTIKGAISKELDCLESSGILDNMDHSEWATPSVPVPKKDGTFHICGDYKVSVNPALVVYQHPLPSVEKIFASLVGGQKFTKLDLSQAYQQLLLDEGAKSILTINTHKELNIFQY